MSQPYRIFLSYTRGDSFVAESVRKRIEAIDGLKVWVDAQDMETGDRQDERIRQALEACDELVVVLSKASVKRSWVLIEVGGAWALGKRVAPLLHDLSVEQVPEPLRRLDCARLDSLDRYLAELRTRVSDRYSSGQPRPLGHLDSLDLNIEDVVAASSVQTRNVSFVCSVVRGLLSRSVVDRRRAHDMAFSLREDPGEAELRRLEDVRSALRTLVRHPHPFVRGEVLYALGLLGSSADSPAVIQGLNDVHTFVQACCANALQHAPPSSAPRVRDALKVVVDATVAQSGSEVVHIYASHALQRLNDREHADAS